MKNAFKLFDFMGTPVYLKYWFFVFLLAGPAIFFALLISVLIHELAHTHVATKRGYPVHQTRFFLVPLLHQYRYLRLLLYPYVRVYPE